MVRGSAVVVQVQGSIAEAGLNAKGPRPP